MSFWISDPKTNKKSVTLTFLTWAIVLASFKLLFSGVAITAAFTFSEFSGIDFGAVLSSVGGIYAWRKMSDSKKDEDIPPIEG